MKNSITRIILVFCACFLLITAADVFLPGNESKIFDGAVRLHVLADSDEDGDQNVKLLVRDAVLDEYGALFSNAESSEDARKTVENSVANIKETADRVLKENGFEYRSTVCWGKEKYPSREYDGVKLPAGEYYSLRIMLGSGKGHNWWCVLFPPLCTGASSSRLCDTGVNISSSRVFTKKKYIFRFKFLEWFGW